MSVRMVSVLSRHLLFLILLTPVKGLGETVEGTSAKLTCFRVEIPKKVTEGETAVLTCNTTCSLTDPTFIWYKNGRPLTTKTTKNNQLHLQTVSSEDAGSYSCAVRGSQHLNSTDQNLTVRYPPKSVSVSISPSGEIVEGSSVNLTCSSDANPPVKNYTWFKGSTPAGTGNTYNIPNIRSEDSGEYTCQSRNELGERRSTAVQIDVLYPPKNVSVSISPSGGIVEGSSVTLTCSGDANPPLGKYDWFKEKRFVGKGQNYTIFNISSEDAGEYKCKTSNEEGHRYSAGTTLIITGPPKSVSVSISPSGEIVEGSSVTLTCSSDANPPVKNYTWFKGSTPAGTGNTYNIPNIRSEDSGEYTCQSRNELGQKSAAVQLNVLYPPKNVSVSISPSGEIVEGSSVTLTCSSDANPPVKIFTWFKEGGTSPVGSGHRFSIISITADSRGWYHCEAWNKLGRLRASAALLLQPEHSYTVVFVVVGLVCTALIVCYICLKIRRAQRKVQNVPPADNNYVSMDCISKHCDDVQTLPLNVPPADNNYVSMDCISKHCDDVQTVPLAALSRPYDGNNTVPNTYGEDLYPGFNAGCSGDSTLDDIYVFPDDEPCGPDAVYANVNTIYADDVYVTPEDGSPEYSDVTQLH